VVVVFTITLGLFGVHRLYLGTADSVPLVYALTLGGFGILMLVDLVILLTTKDLDPYKNNNNVIMWNK